jgi:Ku70/Ku80 beta-barrel domain
MAEETIPMKAIVVTDQAAGTAGMTLVERPEPPAAINDGNRIKYRKVDAETGDEVPQDKIIKGYEVSKGEYIELNPEELEAVAIHSKHTLEIKEFVPKKDINELYLRDPYYIVPDGEVGQQALCCHPRRHQGRQGGAGEGGVHHARARHRA